MVHANIHFVVSGVMFYVSMYGQTSMVSTCSIQLALHLLPLTGQVPSFSLEIQALTRLKFVSMPVSLYGEPHPMLVYISVVDFTKSPWVLTTYLSYSFYPTIHRTQIWHLVVCFIHAILSSNLTSPKWFSIVWPPIVTLLLALGAFRLHCLYFKFPLTSTLTWIGPWLH